MIAARLLIDVGVDPGLAIFQVRTARPGAIETKAQANWVKKGARPSLDRWPQPNVTIAERRQG
jgi:ADP-ribosyl-[dinitrogen reductase] hydrolase